ncbi:MAG TPA: tetratricopeptide repeat protein [Fimbriiglobus sp.]|jgi:Tfp pilus assembly protein PilF
MNVPEAPSTETVRRGRVWFVAIAVVGLLAAAAWYYAIGPAADLRAAAAALERNDPAAARPYLDRRLSYWPSDQRALFLAARAARRTDHYADAERYIVRYEDAYGSTEDSRLEWALLGIQQGDTTGDANRVPNRIDSKHPDFPLVLEAGAKGARAEFLFAYAAKLADQLLKLVPDSGPAHVLQGQLLDLLNRPEQADADFVAAAKLLPHDVTTQLVFAGHLSRAGLTREAIAHFEWVLEVRPGDPDALLGLARALTDNADNAGAVAKLDELLAKDSGNADALTERGRIALRLNRLTEAEEYLVRATKAAPWHREATRLLLLAQTVLNQTDGAARTAARVEELRAEDSMEGRLKLRAVNGPSDIAVRWELWQWAVRNGREDEGLAWLYEIVQAAPKNRQAREALAAYFDRVGQPRRAAAQRAAIGGS